MTVYKCREDFEHVQKRAACHLLMKSAVINQLIFNEDSH